MDLFRLKYMTLAQQGIHLGSPMAFWVISLIVGVAAAFILVLYYRDMRTKSRKRAEALLWIARILVIVWAALVLLEPTIVRRNRLEEASDVVIIVDVSDSMDIADKSVSSDIQTSIAKLTGILTEEQLGKGGKDISLNDDQLSKVINTTRKELIEAFFVKTAGKFISRLKNEYGIRAYSFATDSQPIDASVIERGMKGALASLGLVTKTTDIGAALSEVEKLASKGSISGVIVFTDGNWNAGSDPLMAVRKLGGVNVPLFTIGLGNPEEVKDIEVSAVKAKKSVQVNDTVSVQVDIKSRGYDKETVSILLKEGDRVLQEKKIELKKEMRTQTVRMEFKPTEVRMMLCTAQVMGRKDEARPDNNYRAFEVDVTKGKKKVLYVEQLPRWEWRFIKNAVGRDPDFELSLILFNESDRPSEGEQYLPMMPTTKKELFGYDVVILGDVARDELSEAQLKLIDDFVAEQGSPLVIISGPFHMPQEYKGTGIEKILPVVIGNEAELEGGSTSDEGFSLEITQEGLNSPILNLADTSNENSRIWSELPNLFWCAAVEKAKEGASVLATHSYLSNRYGKVPLIITQRYGAGKVLMLNIDETWRWRYEKGDLYHYRFWGNILRWLAASPLDGKTKHVLLSIDKKEYYPGEKARISARILDTNFYPYGKERIILRVLKTAGGVENISLNSEDKNKGTYTGEFTFAESGMFEFGTVLPELGEEGNAKVRVDVKKISVEDESLQMNKSLLEKIAAISGGSFHDIFSAEAIPDEIINRSRSREEVKRTDLWDNAWVILIVIAFLTGEWVLRKKLGYV
jgi:uncharacterized membrane protein